MPLLIQIDEKLDFIFQILYSKDDEVYEILPNLFRTLDDARMGEKQAKASLLFEDCIFKILKIRARIISDL